jgi:hypothetical protein
MSYNEYKDSYGYLRKMWTNEYDRYHREGSPALIHYYLDGSIDMEVFYIDGRLHREDGPAQLRYYPDGSIKLELFVINSVQHRKCGPAEIWYNPDGSIDSEEFWVYGDFIGYNKVGFWTLWSKLTEVERQSPSILKCLARFS